MRPQTESSRCKALTSRFRLEARQQRSDMTARRSAGSSSRRPEHESIISAHLTVRPAVHQWTGHKQIEVVAMRHLPRSLAVRPTSCSRGGSVTSTSPQADDTHTPEAAASAWLAPREHERARTYAASAAPNALPRLRTCPTRADLARAARSTRERQRSSRARRDEACQHSSSAAHPASPSLGRSRRCAPGTRRHRQARSSWWSSRALVRQQRVLRARVDRGRLAHTKDELRVAVRDLGIGSAAPAG